MLILIPVLGIAVPFLLFGIYLLIKTDQEERKKKMEIEARNA